MTAVSLLEERFTGSLRLFGRKGFLKLQASHVAVAGVGGVGSPCAEALCRAGVGELTLIDADTIERSNLNRQVHALESTLGEPKVEAMARRLKDINPDLKVHALQQRIDGTTLKDFLATLPYYCVEAIDDLKAKALLDHGLYHSKRSFVVAGGAGGRIDPAKLHLGDIARAKGDQLIAHLRTVLRRDYGFPQGGKKFNILCTYSEETPRYAEENGHKVFGALMGVTACAGLMLASEIIRRITEENGGKEV